MNARTRATASVRLASPVGPGSVYNGATRSSGVLVTHDSISAVQWALFVAALVGALLVGAA